MLAESTICWPGVLWLLGLPGYLASLKRVEMNGWCCWLARLELLTVVVVEVIEFCCCFCCTCSGQSQLCEAFKRKLAERERVHFIQCEDLLLCNREGGRERGDIANTRKSCESEWLAAGGGTGVGKRGSVNNGWKEKRERWVGGREVAHNAFWVAVSDDSLLHVFCLSAISLFAMR